MKRGEDAECRDESLVPKPWDTLVEESLTSDGSAKTRNTIVATDLAFELVVISELLVCGNVSTCVFPRVFVRAFFQLSSSGTNV